MTIEIIIKEDEKVLNRFNIHGKNYNKLCKKLKKIEVKEFKREIAQ